MALPLRSSRASMTPDRKFRCTYRLINGECCAHLFSHRKGLQRHIQEVHSTVLQTTFIHYFPSAHGLSKATRTWSGADDLDNTNPLELPAVSVIRDAIAATLQPPTNASLGSPPMPEGWNTMTESVLRSAKSLNHSATIILDAIKPLLATRVTTAEEEPTLQVGDQDDEDPADRPTEHRNIHNTGGRGTNQEGLPQYFVKPSRQIPLQQSALTWLLHSTKARAENAVKDIVSAWGLPMDDATSCLILPQSWKHRDPSQLMSTLTHHNCPGADAERAVLKIDDHQTTLARVIGWFKDWDPPRRGIDLDNFLEAGEFQLHDGSHLCDHGL